MKRDTCAKWVRAALVVGALSVAGCSLLTEPWTREAAAGRRRAARAGAPPAGAGTAAARGDP